MSNPTVQVSLQLATQGLSASLAGVRSTIKAGLSSIGLPTGIVDGFAKLASTAGRFAMTMGKLGVVAGATGTAFAHFTSQASDSWERSQWKFNVIFRDILSEATKTAKQISDVFKINITETMSSMAKIADVTKPLGMDPKVMLEMARSIELLAQGAVQWTEGRYDAVRASTAMMKALVGEKEMLKEFGVVINDQEIFNGIKAAGHAITPLNRAIMTYNLILQRTPDLQRAAFDRIESFSARFNQFKQSIINVGAAIGDFLKPITTEVYDLLATINRKVGELLRAGAFSEWKDLAIEIAGVIRDISDRIATINFDTLKKDFEIVKKMFVEFSSAVAVTLGESISAIFKRIGAELATTISDAIKFGFERAKDVTGINKTKAEMIRMQAQDPWNTQGGNFADRYLREQHMLDFTGARPGEMPSQDKIDWANKFLDFGKAATGPENMVQEQLRIWTSFGERLKDVGKTAKDLGKDIDKNVGGKSGNDAAFRRWAGLPPGPGGASAASGPMGIGSPMGLTGDKLPTLTPENRLKLDRLKLQRREMERKQKNFLDKASGEDPEIIKLRDRRAELEKYFGMAKNDPWKERGEANRKSIAADMAYNAAQIRTRMSDPIYKKYELQKKEQDYSDRLTALSLDPRVPEEERKKRRGLLTNVLAETQKQISELGEKKDRTASLSGLTEAYTSFLERAAGKKATPEAEVKDAVDTSNSFLERIAVADEAYKVLLDKIASSTGATAEAVEKIYQGYGD